MRHYIPERLIASHNAITVDLVGCGGTGSQILSGLVRLEKALMVFGHPGLDVSVFDPDIVSEANIGRQNYSPADIGLNKAIVTVTRVNQFMGLNWKAFPIPYEKPMYDETLLITAVDTAAARIQISNKAKGSCLYWLDVGNSKNTGQVILGTFKEVKQPKAKDAIGNLPTVTDLFDLSTIEEKKQGPSCSLEAALRQQDLMINPVMANFAIQLLWEGFRNGYIKNHGCFVNLKDMRVNPLVIDPSVWERVKAA